MDKIVNTIGEWLWYIFDKIASTNLWPFVITCIIVILLISYVNQYLKVKRTLQRFVSGNFDQETIWRCEELKKTYWSPYAAEAHDAFCIRLSAIYMKQGDLERFFTNINSIKKVTDNISNRLCMLLTVYLIEEDYLAIAEVFQTQKPDELSTADFAVQFLRSKDQEGISTRVMLAKEKISKPEIIELLSKLTDYSGE